ncbi:MAG: CopG family antitoxin [Candidatus Gottesmanbacteria bacterium]|nr:CopG family antitoxin [Candidatus Gottesmanbacteria bacterium]
MKKKMRSRIPTFKTLAEEARFWDTHSFADFEDELKDVDIVVELQKPAEETLILRIQKSLKNRLAKIAKKQGISISSLSRMWLMERLRAMG